MKFEDLHNNAKEVLGQLFLHGPTWDGYLASKTGRDILVDAGLAEHGFGWQWLTRAGTQMAVETGVTPGFPWFDGRWRKKANTTNA
jgi:hypothetical protein